MKIERSFLLASLILFIASLFLPTIITNESSSHPFYISYPMSMGLPYLVIGWMGIFTGMFAWYANIVGLIAFIFTSTKKHDAGIFFASIAILLGLQSLLLTEIPNIVNSDTINYFSIGFYVWILSFVAIFISCLISLLKLKNTNQNIQS